ncbi:hypothetical protein ANN_23463 [Periplaneta americana]|uniref:Cytochrome P450 n=1 Tax=Periplaneta americana TaxID=6978 RepID=A0ABQ8SL79_PERAM|nr:hypothetical protein ANN_23463 [Periplaneta americana]
MQPRSAKLYVGPIDGVADEFVNKIRRLKNRDEEMPANFHNELCKWALESISLVALDKRLGCLADNLAPDSEQQQMITAGIEIIEGFFKLDYGPSYWKYVSTPTWKKFVKSMDCFTNVAWKYVEEAMQRVKSRTCVADGDLSVLERILINEADPRIAFVTALDMMFGGIDTTSNTAAILLYHLTKNPEKQEKLYEETKKFLPSAKDSLTADKLESMKYLKACTKESMRMSPVAFGNGRTLNKDMVLSNYRVPKGTNVFMMHEFLSNREENFPQANKFVPERWLKGPNGEPAESKKTHPFVYMPFGFGPRMCLGRRFAEIEIETLIAKVIRNFRVEYNYGEMEYIVHLILKPASPLKFKMIERE